MIESLMEKRLFIQSKRKNNAKAILPEIKYPTNLSMNGTSLINQLNQQIPIQNKQQQIITKKPSPIIQMPLSNILVSKRITPCNPEDSPYQIRKKTHYPINKKSSSNPTMEEQINQSREISHRITSTSQSENLRRKMNEQMMMNFDKPHKPSKNEEFAFVIGKGNNNEDLVRKILIDRKIWKQIKWGQYPPHLKWVFCKEKHNYKKMWSYTKTKSINHFQNNEELGEKDNLIYNLQIYCETKKLQIFSLTPITFCINFDDQYCQYNLKQFLAFFLKNDPRKNQNPLKKNGFVMFNFINKFQSYMAWQNSDIKKKVNILSRPVNNATYYSGGQNPSYIWLLKPIGLNRGRGIEIFDSLQQLQSILTEYLILGNRKQHKEVKQKKNKPKEDEDEMEFQQNQSKVLTEKVKLNTFSFVIQKYVERPLLISNRKFDIRVWTLVTQTLNVYFFKEGYIRTSTQAYSTQDINNYFIHLTNNAIQKNSEHYGMFESGNQLSFRDLENFISPEATNLIWQKMKEISYMAFSSVKRKLNPNGAKNCFEIFGLDFIIDQQLKVWLIEVNENPSLECSSPLLQAIIPRMINDAFKLTIDQIFTEKKPYQKSYPVKGYENNENLWLHLGHLVPNAQYSPKKQQGLGKSCRQLK